MLRTTATLATLLMLLPGALRGRQSDQQRVPRPLIPEFLSGPRQAVTSASLLAVMRNPNAYGRGVEAELSIGTTLPVFLLAESSEGDPMVVGVEAAAFARFALQVLQREMVATDWFFAVPLVWHRKDGWLRFRFYHTSSHMGDEYARRFQDPGVNFSRDALEVIYFHSLGDPSGIYGGARYAYNVHPDKSKRWVLRGGGQVERTGEDLGFRPFLAADVEWDQDAGRSPRLEMRTGLRVRNVGILRGLRVSLTFLTGPSPLGQFNGKQTTQVGLTVQKIL
jgi:hypothetical protein